MQIVVTDDAAAAAAEAAGWVARRIRSAVRLRGVCRIAVSGGSTPALMFDELATMALPWSDVHVFQVDERIAPDGDPDRNTVQLHDHLVDRIDLPSRNLHLMPVTSASPRRGASAYAKALGGTPLDIVHLGVGDDGHTASWPPGDAVIDAPGQVAVSDVFNGRTRMTITPAVVNGARARLALAVGAGKAVPLSQWLSGSAAIPVARVRRSGTTLVTDIAGARLLPNR